MHRSPWRSAALARAGPYVSWRWMLGPARFGSYFGGCFSIYRTSSMPAFGLGCCDCCHRLLFNYPIFFWTAYPPRQGEGNPCAMSTAAADLNHSPIKCGSAPRFAERDLWNIDRTAASVRLDVEGPDDLAPLFAVVSDELAEIGGRAKERPGAELGEPRLDFWIGEAGGYWLNEAVDKFWRRGLARA